MLAITGGCWSGTAMLLLEPAQFLQLAQGPVQALPLGLQLASALPIFRLAFQPPSARLASAQPPSVLPASWLLPFWRLAWLPELPRLPLAPLPEPVLLLPAWLLPPSSLLAWPLLLLLALLLA
jgi:hypothetical protein